MSVLASLPLCEGLSAYLERVERAEQATEQPPAALLLVDAERLLAPGRTRNVPVERASADCRAFRVSRPGAAATTHLSSRFCASVCAGGGAVVDEPSACQPPPLLLAPQPAAESAQPFGAGAGGAADAACSSEAPAGVAAAAGGGAGETAGEPGTGVAVDEGSATVPAMMSSS